jgi:transcriptional regulator with XRE-family HTH domain
MDLMEKLFNYRKDNNLTWVKLCKKTGVSNTSLKSIYRKERIAGDQVKFKIAKFLHNLDINNKILFEKHAPAIKYYRQLLNLSQKELAKLAGYSTHATINRLERTLTKKNNNNHERCNPAILTLEKLIGREIVKRNYLPCWNKKNIARNVIEKYYLVMTEIFEKMGLTSTQGYRLLDDLDNYSNATIDRLAEAMGVDCKLFYDRNFANKFFCTDGELKGV